MKQISETDIENLKSLIRNRNSYSDIKEVLDNLEDYSPQKIKVNPKSTTISANSIAKNLVISANDTKTADILKDLKDLIHSRAKSTILEVDIKEIINKYGI